MYFSAPNYSPTSSAYVLHLIPENKFIPIKTTVKIALLCGLVFDILDNKPVRQNDFGSNVSR